MAPWGKAFLTDIPPIVCPDRLQVQLEAIGRGIVDLDVGQGALRIEAFDPIAQALVVSEQGEDDSFERFHTHPTQDRETFSVRGVLIAFAIHEGEVVFDLVVQNLPHQACT